MEIGYIFDFDGVLVNTMPLHFAAYSQALKEVGVPLDRDQFYRQAGMTGREQIACFCRKAGVKADVEAIYQRKNVISKDHFDLVDPIPCNIDLFRTLKNAGFPVAIASGSSKPSILPVTERYGIPAEIIISSEDVERGKPHPDLFLEAAKRLNLRPENCVVVEDSEVGVEAACAGGMHCFRYFAAPA
jgi:beta-phosphoglucomutase-like phosphatase (HAD superfamily)